MLVQNNGITFPNLGCSSLNKSADNNTTPVPLTLIRVNILRVCQPPLLSLQAGLGIVANDMDCCIHDASGSSFHFSVVAELHYILLQQNETAIILPGAIVLQAELHQHGSLTKDRNKA